VGGAVDAAATAALRAAPRGAAGHFHFGPERDGYEARWTGPAYDRLTEILAALPIHWRFFTKTQIFARMQGLGGVEGVNRAFAEVCARFPDLPTPLAQAAE
jgi:N-methylhydantoinase B